MIFQRLIFLLLLNTFVSITLSPDLASAESLPEGKNGIAANYPGDQGIAADPNVIFADDFETYSDSTGLTSKWTQAYHSNNIRIVTEPGTFYGGKQALEFTVPRQSAEVSNTLLKRLSSERNLLFLRFYAKYDQEFNVLGSSHNGATISSNYCCPGVPADGTNKFFISYETGRWETGTANPGYLNIYIYHPEQRDVWGDHFYPTGEVRPYTYLPYDFGQEFMPRHDVIPLLGQWYCYEIMVKANTPGQRDGRIAMWIDGKLIADFLNLRLRDTTALKIDQFTIDLHVNSNTLGVAKKWYDNVVAADSYIGPIQTSETAPPQAPKNFRRVLKGPLG